MCISKMPTLFKGRVPAPLPSIDRAVICTQAPCDGCGFEAPHIRHGKFALVIARAALPQDRVETMIASQVNFEITNKIRRHFLSDNTTLKKLFKIKLMLKRLTHTQNKHKLNMSVVSFSSHLFHFLLIVVNRYSIT